MIVRIVKMTFEEGKVNDFLKVFEASRLNILNFKGCTRVDLLKDINQPNVYFTYSHWVDEQHLTAYRNSEFFKATWAKTKVLFVAKPEAYSLSIVQETP